MTKKPAPFPTREQILEFLADNHGNLGKREIARAFGLNAEQKRDLKKVLRQMQEEGVLQKGRGKKFAEPGTLPDVTVLSVTGVDVDGELLARPLQWEGDAPPPTIYMTPERKGVSALSIGDRVLARLTPLEKGVYEARTIRRLTEAPALVLGLFKEDPDGLGLIRPTDRRMRYDLIVEKSDRGDAVPGDLVRAEVLPGKRLGLRRARIIESLHAMDDPKAISLIAIHSHDIRTEFPAAAVEQAEAASAPVLDGRVDFRELPLVTIDGSDARDFDDAVFAEPDDSPDNDGGWHLIVAIADVSWYVRPGSPLDNEALKRGNSTYFPDRVVPMLPEALSNGWCSLVPHEERGCLVAHLWIDKFGHLKRHKFERGLMRSAARLTYEQVQAAHNGDPDDTTAPLMDSVITPLYRAYAALWDAREDRGVLDLDLPEKQIVLDEAGHVSGVIQRERLDSHKLIEEFMILANVAAAEALEKKKMPAMYRIHDHPSVEKLESLREFLQSVDMSLPRGQTIRPKQFNQILTKAKDTPQAHLINEVVLRSQAQAEYNPDNIGHFGLALRRYCHFTSPIRRYADLLVHRALIQGWSLGDGGLKADHDDFHELGEAISACERRSSAAERDAVDRFTAAYLSEKVGSELLGRINGVTRFGLFVTLTDSGGDGLIPIRTLPDDYYIHDESRHELVGRKTRNVYRMGENVTVRLVEASPITGGMVLELVASEGHKAAPGRHRDDKGRRPHRGRPPKHSGKPKTPGRKRKR